MRLLTTSLLTLLLATPAWAGGVTVWMQDQVEDKAKGRADKQTGGTVHTTAVDLAVPPMPARAEDGERIEAIRKAVAAGRKRWNEFEVERVIAAELNDAVDAVTILRDERDRDQLIDALLFEGAAVRVAFEDEELINGDDAEPYRVDRVGGVELLPWIDALALDPSREPLPSDVADGATFPALQEAVARIRALPAGSVDFYDITSSDQRYLDGLPVDDDLIEVRPGRHWVHVERNGVVSGRRIVRVQPGETVAIEPFVTSDDLATASKRVLAESTTGLPDSVRASIDRIAGRHDGQVFIAADGDAGFEVLPYASGATLLEQRRITLLGVGDIGGGFISSPIFDGAEGEAETAWMVGGNLGLELGIYNLMLFGGVELSMTPGQTITYGKQDGSGNIDTSTYLQPYAGLGFYLLRPAGRRATLMLGANYQFLQPSHHAVGGRLAFGVPVDDDGDTWFRITASGATFGTSIWDEDGETGRSILQGALRGGLATRF